MTEQLNEIIKFIKENQLSVNWCNDPYVYVNKANTLLGQISSKLKSLLSETGNERKDDREFLQTQFPGKEGSDLTKNNDDEELKYILQIPDSTTQRDEEKKNEPTEEKGVIIMEFFPM